MPTRNALERLAAARPPLAANVEALVDADEEDRILRRILASDKQADLVRRRLRPRLLLAGAGIVTVAVGAAVAAGAFDHSNPPVAKSGDHHRVALTGPRIELAGYHFRTPAGFKASSSACEAAPAAGTPTTVLNGFAAAASADGGCVEAAFLISGSSSATDARPPDAEPVDVGAYQGYLTSQGSSGDTLYVELPAGAAPHPYLVLFAQGLTEDELIAVAGSGLPASP